jgi:uncharacterized repeat protein (TIGR03803 family)
LHACQEGAHGDEGCGTNRWNSSRMNSLRLFLLVFTAATLFAACSGRSVTPFVPSAAVNGASGVARDAASYKLLYSFKGSPDGASPLSGLVNLNGTLYGTTLNGSSNYCAQSCGSNGCYLGCGTVFTVDASGTESVIYNFNGNFNNAGDGSWPFAGLTALHGLLYGTTAGSGAHGDGTVFRVSASGKEKVLYSFAGGSDGQDPEATLISVKGTLYGTTVYGGGSGCGGTGCGTVFSVARNGSEHVLYAFQGGNDGYRVFAPLTYLNGKFYGATLQGGGTGCGGNGCGTIFELTPSGSENVIYSFGNGASGAFPNGLTAVNGVFYGTTEGGGSRSSGTFFSVTPSGSLQFLYSFKDIPDGNLPGATLLYHKRLFYGTTVGGGTSGNGTVFSISKAGAENVLYSFQGGSDGAAPQAAVTAVKSNVYSTTYKGGGTGCGGYGCGTAFRVKI